MSSPTVQMPAPVDGAALAAQQGQNNLQAAVATSLLNQTNEVTPYGTVSYTRNRGGYADTPTQQQGPSSYQQGSSFGQRSMPMPQQPQFGTMGGPKYDANGNLTGNLGQAGPDFNTNQQQQPQGQIDYTGMPSTMSGQQPQSSLVQITNYAKSTTTATTRSRSSTIFRK